MQLIGENLLKRIFVGRKIALKKIFSYWEVQREDPQELAHILLNIPGIGKTRLIEFFGECISEGMNPLTREGQDGINGVYIKFQLNSTDILRDEFTTSFMKIVSDSFHSYFMKDITRIPESWKDDLKLPLSKMKPWKLLLSTLEIKNYKEISKSEDRNLSLLANQIPLILHIDEIQEGVGSFFIESDGQKLEKYQQISTMVAGLINAKVLVILTGTQFTMLRKIGSVSTSPLNGKTLSLILPYLDEADIRDYVDLVFIQTDTDRELQLKHFYTNWLTFYSGGHPRTMEFLTRNFLHRWDQYKDILLRDDLDKSRYSLVLKDMFSIITTRTMETLRNHYWKSKYEKYFQKSQVNIPDTIIKQIIAYILKLVFISSKLGDLDKILWKKYHKAIKDKRNLEDFLSILVESGYLLISGDNNYYTPSLFAFQAFAEDFSEISNRTLALFKEFTRHPLIIEMLQYTGQLLGWSLELILKYALLTTVPDAMLKNSEFPKAFGINYCSTIPSFPPPTRAVLLNGNLTEDRLENLEENIYYLFPASKDFDGCIRFGNSFLLIQLKAIQNFTKVIQSFKTFKERIINFQISLDEPYTAIPWFLSFHGGDFSDALKDYEGILTSNENHWIKLLGSDLVQSHRK
jgi:hypothetical protein